MGDLLITNGWIVLPELGEVDADLLIRDGRVVAMGTGLNRRGTESLDASGCHVFPGFIDPHVHLGNYRDFELDAASESRAAAHGGITTLLTFVKVLRHRREESSYIPLIDELRDSVASSSLVDIGLHLAISTPEHIAELPKYYERGVRSFKMYMGYRSDAAARKRGSVGVTDGFILQAMRQIAKMPGSFALIHCENEEIAEALVREVPEGPWTFSQWADTRPPLIEAEAVQRAMFLAQSASCPFYAVHISSAAALEVIDRVRPGASAPMAVETNLHHLLLTREDGAAFERVGTAKVSPPLRDQRDVDALWVALAEGRAATVGTDHCCVDEEFKEGDARAALPGFPAMDNFGELLLGESVRRGIPLTQVARFASYNSARMFGLYPRKGTLMPGSDGDVVVIRLYSPHRIDARANRSDSRFSPYHGRRTDATVVATVRGGTVIYDESRGVVDDTGGRLVAAAAPR